MNVRKKLVRTLLSAGLVIVMTVGAALASIGTGTVTADSLRLRGEANTNSKTLALVPKNTTVTLLEKVSDSWYRVKYNNLEGYMSADWLDVTLTEEASAQAPSAGADGEQSLQGRVNAGPLNVRSGPGTSYGKVGSLKKGALVTIEDDSVDGWYKITSGSVSGYVSADYITLGADAVSEPLKGMVTTGSLNVRSGPGTSYGKAGSLKRGATVTIEETLSGWYKISSPVNGYVSADYVALLDGTAGTSSVGAAAAAMAASLVGCRYVYGAEGPNTFDCSGLIYYIFGQLGYKLSRGSSAQYRNNGVFVAREDIQPGDLVFFFDPKYDNSGGTLPTTHVGIYVGNNQFINASTVTYKVQYDTLFGSYYGNYVVGFKRIG